jgi:transcriptional regulator with XRE-family HTH domain
MARPKFSKLAKRGKQEHPIRRCFRANLRNRRIELGLEQWQLGERVGASQAWINNLERPGRDEVPNLYLLSDLAQELGCTPADLLMPGRFNVGIPDDADLRTLRRKIKRVPGNER